MFVNAELLDNAFLSQIV